MDHAEGNMPTNSPQKRSGLVVVLVIVIILLVCGLAVALGFLFFRNKVNTILDQTNSTSDLPTLPTSLPKNPQGGPELPANGCPPTRLGETTTWPSNSPAPQYTKGTICGALESKLDGRETWSVTITGSSNDDLNDYFDSLKKAGWTIDDTATQPNHRATKGKLSVAGSLLAVGDNSAVQLLIIKE